MNITQLQAFTVLSETGNFRKAAERLGRTQPSLTKIIQSLEAEIGFPLLERMQGGTRVTDAGERLLQRARIVMNEMRILQEEAASMHADQGGLVKVGASPAAAISLVPQACRSLLQRYPEAEIDVVSTLYPEILKSLRDASLDVAIGPLPESVPSDIVVDRLFDMPVVIVTSQSQTKKSCTNLADVFDETWIIHGPAGGPSSLFAATFELNAVGLPKAQIRCHSLNATLELVAQLDAFCVLSKPVFDYHSQRFGLAAVPVSANMPAFKMSIATYRHRSPTQTTLQFKKYLTQVAGN